MKIIKRSGTEVPFDIEKIVRAIEGANSEADPSDRLTDDQIALAAHSVEWLCERAGHTVSVEEIQDMVENQIMAAGRYDVATPLHHLPLRAEPQAARPTPPTTSILSLIECNNEEVKQENSNKNPTVNSRSARLHGRRGVQGPHRRACCCRQDIVEAHEEGIIHFHDTDYFAQHMHNCDLVNLEDMLQNGTVISGTLIEKPAQLFDRLQHRHADHRAGRQQPVRRPVASR